MNLYIDEVEKKIEKDLLNLCLYGYGVFTTFFVKNRKVKGLNYHLDRLNVNSLDTYEIAINKSKLRKEINKYLDKKKKENLVIRITILPVDFNLGKPTEIKKLKFFITSKECIDKKLSKKSLLLVNMKKKFSNIKTSSFYSNIQSRVIAHKKGFDDSLFYSKKSILEGSTWNIFFIKGDTIYTPKSKNYLLEGVTKKIIKDICKNIKIDICEIKIKKQNISKYDGAFITNSGIGIDIVSQIDNYKYNYKKIKKITDVLIFNYNNIKGDVI